MNKILSPKNIPLKKIRVRFAAISFIFLLGFLLLGARTFELNLSENDKLRRLAKNQYKRRIVVAPKRGNILDRNGETLAIDIKVDSVYASPHRVEDPEVLAKNLGKILGISKQKILKKLAKKNRKFVWIKRRISPEESREIKNLKLQGFGTLPEYKRFYPNGKLAANLIGAVGYDAKALSGLEMSLDSYLMSKDPPMLVEQDAKGRSYAPFGLVGLEHPKQVVLTIDKTIQYITERALSRAVEKAKAKGGMAIVLEANTGEILAMASVPSFDPNHYYDYEYENWRNRAITDTFEPGSIFKAITMAAALESEVLQPNDKMHCENGAMRVGKNTIHDTHGYGLISLTEIMKYSSNICSFKIAQKMGKDLFSTWIRDFGFGKKTGISAPGEENGLLSPPKNWSKVQLGTIGFGQGISTTSLQVAMAYGALANGGHLMKPLLVKEIRDSEGSKIKSFSPASIKNLLKESTAKTMIEMLQTVVEKGGTGTQAALEAYTVAGKTGTAQKVDPGIKGYAKNKYVASFVGMAPTEQPKLVTLVTIDEPKGAYYGGVVSGPVFKEIMGQSLAYLKVPPTFPDKPLEKTKVAKVHKIKKTSKPDPVKITEPKKLSKVAEEPKDTGALTPDTEGFIPIPKLTGLSVREALRKAHAQNFKIEIQGTGICQQQEPQAGELAAMGTPILVECQPPI